MPDHRSAPTVQTTSSAPLDAAVSFHEGLAGKWEQKYRKSSFATRQEIIRESLTGVRLKTSTWLDAGCGTGTLSRWLAEKGCHVEAVDAAPEMLRIAEDLTSQASETLPITFRRVTSIETLPFAANSFDGILCSSVLEYVSDPDTCLDELRRVLRPTGVLLISIPSSRSIVRILLRVAHVCTAVFGRPWPKYLSISRHQYSVREFMVLLQAHGLRPEKFVCFGTPAARWFPNNAFLGSLLMFRASKQ